MKYNCHVMKLNNKEDIICIVEEKKENTYIISSPLQMQSHNEITQKGLRESLGLSRWIQPFSDERVYELPISSVTFTAPASVGLSRYYAYVLKSMEDKNLQPTIIDHPTEMELNEILDEDFTNEDIIFTPVKTTLH